MLGDCIMHLEQQVVDIHHHILTFEVLQLKYCDIALPCLCHHVTLANTLGSTWLSLGFVKPQDAGRGIGKQLSQLPFQSRLSCH